MHENVAGFINAFWPPTRRGDGRWWSAMENGVKRTRPLNTSTPANGRRKCSRTPLLKGRSWCRQVHATSLRLCLLEGIDAHATSSSVNLQLRAGAGACGVRISEWIFRCPTDCHWIPPRDISNFKRIPSTTRCLSLKFWSLSLWNVREW